MDGLPEKITLSYDSHRIVGIFRSDIITGSSTVLSRFKNTLLSQNSQPYIDQNQVEISWPEALGLVREFGTKALQQSLNFRFEFEGAVAEKIRKFVSELRLARSFRNSFTEKLSQTEIEQKLVASGFSKRSLKPFQLRDIEHLLALPNGANFSVPGAGKTTVTFALHILTRESGTRLLVIAPKSAFQAWRDVVNECMIAEAPDRGDEPFTILGGTELQNDLSLRYAGSRFIISYDLIVRQQALLSAYISQNPVHVVLDESHRMKAGISSQRGAYLLNIAELPIRKDILSGTPMPQDASDIASQLGFLWPGHGLDLEIMQGVPPRQVLQNLYVRTTKHELGLPEAKRIFYDVGMDKGQLALYSIVRSEALRQFSKTLTSYGKNPDYLKARRSVMRLLQLSVNPVLALSGMGNDDDNIDSGIVDQVLDEGTSSKMKAVMDHARTLASQGRKSVIWTIFTDTIHVLHRSLADLNPVYIHGGIGTGDESDIETREGRIKRFHDDPNCFVLIANPAAAGEGINLHQVCHDAIYLDRSYVSTHYLQSIDRIHRLGLPPDVETNIHIYRTRAPAEIGSIDLSVSRRLAIKIRNMQQLLDDPDLHTLALDEENAVDPIDYDIELQDIIDLVAELEGKGPNQSVEEL